MNTAHRRAVSRALRASEARAAVRRLLGGMGKEGGAPRILYPVVAAVVNALGFSTTSRFTLEKTEKLMAEALLADLMDWDFNGYLDDGLYEMGAKIQITKEESTEDETEVSYEDSPHAYGFSWGRGPMVSDSVLLTFDEPSEVTYNWTVEKSLLEIAKHGNLPKAIMKLGKAGAFMPLGSDGRVDHRGDNFDSQTGRPLRFSGVSYMVVAKTLKDRWRDFVPIIKSTFRKGLTEMDKTMETDPDTDGLGLEITLQEDHLWDTSPSAPLESMKLERAAFQSSLRGVSLDGNNIKVSVLTVADDFGIELEWGEPDGSDYDDPRIP